MSPQPAWNVLGNVFRQHASAWSVSPLLEGSETDGMAAGGGGRC